MTVRWDGRGSPKVLFYQGQWRRTDGRPLDVEPVVTCAGCGRDVPADLAQETVYGIVCPATELETDLVTGVRIVPINRYDRACALVARQR